MDLFEAASKVSGIAPPAASVEPEVMEDSPLAKSHKNPFDLVRLQTSLAPFREKVEELVVKSHSLRITNPTTNKTAVEMGGQLATLRGTIEDKRKAIIAPYDEIVRGINKMVKDFRDPIDKATGNLKLKIGAYSREQAEIARRIAAKKAAEEAEARRIQMEKDRAEALEKQRLADEEAARKQKELDAIAKREGVESVKVVAEQIEIPEEVEVVVAEVKIGPTRTDAGTASTIPVWDYKVVNVDEIPRDYLEVNHRAIKEAIKAGMRQIPGVEIFEDTQVRFRTK